MASVETLNRLDRNGAEMKALAAHERTTERRVDELYTNVVKLSLVTGSLSDKLMEVSRDVNHLKEALTEQLAAASHRNIAEMKSLYAEKSESLRTTLTSLSTSVPSDSKTHQ